MPRNTRIEFPGAFYHVMTRGNQKRNIFRSDNDREKLLQKLLEYKRRYEYTLLAYTLMPNHIHLLLETSQIPLSKIMQGILQSHTQWFNRKYKTNGHLFQGRYKAIICDKKAYLLALVRYLHINCVRAGIVKNPSEYQWSSHRIYLGIESSDLVETELVLEQFSNNRRRAIGEYKSFIEDAIDDGDSENFYQVTDQRFLGDESFIERVANKIGKTPYSATHIDQNRTLHEIAGAVKKLTGLGRTDLRKRTRGKTETVARSLFIHLALKYSNCKRKTMAVYLHRTPKMISYLEAKLSKEKVQEFDTKLEW
jgi:REP element-mobilizing transposase RayT